MAGVSSDLIKDLISSWRLKIESHEHAIKTNDAYEQIEPTGNVSGSESGRLINQAHINQLEADIIDLERLLP